MLVNEVRVGTYLCQVLRASRQSGLKDGTLQCTVCIYIPQGSVSDRGLVMGYLELKFFLLFPLVS